MTQSFRVCIIYIFLFSCCIRFTQPSAIEPEKTLFANINSNNKNNGQPVRSYLRTGGSVVTAATSTVSFELDLSLAGISNPVLDQSSRDAVLKTVAVAMNISEIFLSYTQPPAKRSQESVYNVDLTVSIINYPVVSLEMELSTYKMLVARFEESQQYFDGYLHKISSGLMAAMTLNANLQTYYFTDPFEGTSSTDTPTISPVSGNSVGGSTLDDAKALPLWAFLAIVAFLIVAILMCCVCFFAPSSICDPLFLVCCPGALAKEKLMEVESRRNSFASLSLIHI